MILRQRIRLIAAVLSLVAAFTVGSVARAAAAPRLHLTDVLGKQVSVADGAPSVVIFMSRTAKDACAAFARAIDERLLAVPIDSVGVVDARRYGGMLRRIAMHYMRRSEEDAYVKRRERRQQHGVDASAAAVERWHLVGDFDGSLFARFGVGAEPKQPVAFVVDAGGALHGPFADVDHVVAAVTSSSGSAGR